MKPSIGFLTLGERVNYEIVDGKRTSLLDLMRLSMASGPNFWAAVWMALRWPFLRTGYDKIGTYMPYTINTRNHIPMQGLVFDKTPVGNRA